MAPVEMALQHLKPHFFADLSLDRVLGVFALVDISRHKNIGIPPILLDQKDLVQLFIHDDHADRRVVDRKAEFLTLGAIGDHALPHQIFFIQLVAAVHTVFHFHDLFSRECEVYTGIIIIHNCVGDIYIQRFGRYITVFGRF